MVPIVVLNGVMCFLLALALAWSDAARAHPVALTVLAGVLWLCVYAVLEARNVVVPWGAAIAVFTAACVVASVAITIWLWPACTTFATEAPVRAGGLAGVLDSWIRIVLFALSLLRRVRRRALLPGCACRHRPAGRLAHRAAVRALHGGERSRLRPCRGAQAGDHAVDGAGRVDDRIGVRGRAGRLRGAHILLRSGLGR